VKSGETGREKGKEIEKGKIRGKTLVFRWIRLQLSGNAGVNMNELTQVIPASYGSFVFLPPRSRLARISHRFVYCGVNFADDRSLAGWLVSFWRLKSRIGNHVALVVKLAKAVG
jgi:hypothetical protein